MRDVILVETLGIWLGIALRRMVEWAEALDLAVAVMGATDVEDSLETLARPLATSVAVQTTTLATARRRQ